MYAPYHRKNRPVRWVTSAAGGVWQNEAGETIDFHIPNESGNFPAYVLLDDGSKYKRLIVLMQTGPQPTYLNADTLDVEPDIQWIYAGGPDVESKKDYTSHASIEAGKAEAYRRGEYVPEPGDHLHHPDPAKREIAHNRLYQQLVDGHLPVVSNTFEQTSEGSKAVVDEQVQNRYQDGKPTGVSWKELRSWYTDERYEVVRQGLYERTMLRINARWPGVVALNKAHDLATAIIDDLTVHSDDGMSEQLHLVLLSLNSDNQEVWNEIRNMQSAMGRVFIVGPIQAPWEAGEEIDWSY